MNIFFIEQTTKEIARSYADEHVNVGIKEKAQMLSEALIDNRVESDKIYNKFNINHPMSIWVRTSKENYEFTINLARQLNKEFKIRGFKGGIRNHSSMKVINEAEKLINKINFPEEEQTQPPYTFNDIDVVGKTELEKWRRFYVLDKLGRVSYKRKPERKPEWFNMEYIEKQKEKQKRV